MEMSDWYITKKALTYHSRSGRINIEKGCYRETTVRRIDSYLFKKSNQLLWRAAVAFLMFFFLSGLSVDTLTEN